MITLLLDDQATHFIPHFLDRNLHLAHLVAPLTGGTEQEGIEHHLVELSLTLKILAQEIPAASGCLTFPLPTVVLVTNIDAIPALGTGVSLVSKLRWYLFGQFRLMAE